MRRLSLFWIAALTICILCIYKTAPETGHLYRVVPDYDVGTQGTKGRLILSGYSAALYESTGWDAQAIVDAEDSAAWFMWYESQSPIIADHCTQGFDVIKGCVVGDVCYIVYGDIIQPYICVTVDTGGINKRTDMYLSDGYNFMRKNDPGRLYMYTCNEAGDPYHITVVVWEPVCERSDIADWCNGSTTDFEPVGVGS